MAEQIAMHEAAGGMSPERISTEKITENGKSIRSTMCPPLQCPPLALSHFGGCDPKCPRAEVSWHLYEPPNLMTCPYYDSHDPVTYHLTLQPFPHSKSQQVKESKGRVG